MRSRRPEVYRVGEWVTTTCREQQRKGRARHPLVGSGVGVTEKILQHYLVMTPGDIDSYVKYLVKAKRPVKGQTSLRNLFRFEKRNDDFWGTIRNVRQQTRPWAHAVTRRKRPLECSKGNHVHLCVLGLHSFQSFFLRSRHSIFICYFGMATSLQNILIFRSTHRSGLRLEPLFGCFRVEFPSTKSKTAVSSCVSSLVFRSRCISWDTNNTNNVSRFLS